MTKRTNQARIAVIGTGWWATEAHIPAVLAHPDAELVAVCDTRPDKAQAVLDWIAAQPGPPPAPRFYTDHHAMLSGEDIDAAIVVTPHATHYELVRDCLQAGRHVLVEKPMTLYARDARHLVELAQAQGRALMVGYPYPHLPASQQIKAVLDSGALGAVQYVNGTFASDVRNFFGGHVGPGQPPVRMPFRLHGPGEDYNRPQLLGGGHGHLQMTHLLGLLFFLTDLRVAQVHALMANYGLPLDLVDAMAVQFEGGALGVIGGTGNAGRNYKLGVTLYCEAGVVDIDTANHHALVRRADGSLEDLSIERGGVESRFMPAHNLIDVVLGRAANLVTGTIGWRAVELLDAAYRSAHDDGRGVKTAELYAP